MLSVTFATLVLSSFKAPNADDEGEEGLTNREESEDELTVAGKDVKSTADDLFFYSRANLSLSEIARYYNIRTLERLQLMKQTELNVEMRGCLTSSSKWPWTF